MKKLTPSEEDRESLEQVEGLLQPLKAELERKVVLPKRRPGDVFVRSHGQTSRQAALQKMNELQKSIDGWEGKDIGQCCSEVVMGMFKKRFFFLRCLLNSYAYSDST